MSLENALEEESRSVVKLLEGTDLSKRPSSTRYHSGSSTPSHYDSHGRKHSTSSMLLDADSTPPRRPSTSMLLDASSTSNSSKVTLDDTLKPSRSSPTKPDNARPTALRPTKSSDASRAGSWSNPGHDKTTTLYNTRPKTTRSYSHSNMLSPSRSTDSNGYNVITQQGSRSRSNSRHRKDDMNFDFAFRRLSNNNLRRADGALGNLYRSPSADGRQVFDDDYESTEGEESGVSSESDDSDDNSGDDDDDLEEEDLKGLTSRIIKSDRATKSLMAAMEEERKSVESSKFRVKSLLDAPLPPGAVPPPSLAEYAAYKRRVIHPTTAFDNEDDMAYFSDEEEIIEARRATNLPIDIAPIQNMKATKRMVRVLTRGEAAEKNPTSNPKTFVLGTDLSPESTHAMEWTIGTVLRDHNVLYIVSSFEDDGNAEANRQEDDRMDAMEQLTLAVEKLLKRTRLQVFVIIEVIHTKTPKNVLMSVIDHVKPTMVVMGSRGRNALKGVLLGSFSNYIVERSNVPVMVARRKLQKSKHKDLNPRLANNLRDHEGEQLSHAKVD